MAPIKAAHSGDHSSMMYSCGRSLYAPEDECLHGAAATRSSRVKSVVKKMASQHGAEGAHASRPGEAHPDLATAWRDALALQRTIRPAAFAFRAGWDSGCRFHEVVERLHPFLSLTHELDGIILLWQLGRQVGPKYCPELEVR